MGGGGPCAKAPAPSITNVTHPTAMLRRVMCMRFLLRRINPLTHPDDWIVTEVSRSAQPQFVVDRYYIASPWQSISCGHLSHTFNCVKIRFDILPGVKPSESLRRYRRQECCADRPRAQRKNDSRGRASLHFRRNQPADTRR